MHSRLIGLSAIDGATTVSDGSAVSPHILNLSLFLAFAILNSEAKVLLFFFIPIKVKWLALVDLIILAINFTFSGWIVRVAILFSLFNVVLFFWKGFYYRISSQYRRKRFKMAYDRVEQKNQREQEKRQKHVKAKVKDLPKENENNNDDLFGF